MRRFQISRKKAAASAGSGIGSGNSDLQCAHSDFGCWSSGMNLQQKKNADSDEGNAICSVSSTTCRFLRPGALGRAGSGYLAATTLASGGGQQPQSVSAESAKNREPAIQLVTKQRDIGFVALLLGYAQAACRLCVTTQSVGKQRIYTGLLFGFALAVTSFYRFSRLLENFDQTFGLHSALFLFRRCDSYRCELCSRVRAWAANQICQIVLFASEKQQQMHTQGTCLGLMRDFSEIKDQAIVKFWANGCAPRSMMSSNMPEIPMHCPKT
eukprot:s1084_g7.t1